MTNSSTIDKARIPVTVGILTYNSSIQTVEATIRSVLGCVEILLCDAHSTDGTRELAESLGCRIIDQAPEFVDASGRLIDEAGVNGQILDAAKHDWVFFLDHDELATPELLDDIRAVISAPPEYGAYEIPRLYSLDGRIIECATNYPSLQIRLVRRDAIEGFRAIIHASVVMKDGQLLGRLAGHQIVPLLPFRELWQKWRGYMRLEEVQQASLSSMEWRTQVLRTRTKAVKWLAWRIYKVRRECDGYRMPLRYELGRIAYEACVIFYTGRRFVGLGRANVNKAWR